MATRLTVEDFTALPDHRKERVKSMLLDRGIEYQHVFLIVKHPHTWEVHLYHPFPPVVGPNREFLTRVVTVRGGRW